MEFFGLTQYGSQNYIKDTLNDGYVEPLRKEDVEPLLKKIEQTTLPTKVGPRIFSKRRHGHIKAFRRSVGVKSEIYRNLLITSRLLSNTARSLSKRVIA